MLIAIAIMIVIVVAIAGKAAVDPNLGKNAAAMKGMMGGNAMDDSI